jgi:hypothetical protein
MNGLSEFEDHELSFSLLNFILAKEVPTEKS